MLAAYAMIFAAQGWQDGRPMDMLGSDVWHVCKDMLFCISHEGQMRGGVFHSCPWKALNSLGRGYSFVSPVLVGTPADMKGQVSSTQLLALRAIC